MEHWNVLVTVHEGYYRSAFEILEQLGNVSRPVWLCSAVKNLKTNLFCILIESAA